MELLPFLFELFRVIYVFHMTRNLKQPQVLLRSKQDSGKCFHLSYFFNDMMGKQIFGAMRSQLFAVHPGG